MARNNVALAEPVADFASGYEEPERSRRPLIIAAVGAVVVAALAGVYFLFLAPSSSGEDLGLVVPARQPAANAAPAPAPDAVVADPGVTIGRNPFAPVKAGSSQVDAPTISIPAAPQAASGGVTLEMVSLDPTSATVKVDGTSYTAKVGETFASDFKVYGIFGTQCAGVLFGTQSVPLCVGDVRTLTK